MGGLFTALNAGRTALSVNQKSIEIIGNNISNVNTEGYSRQTADLTPYPSMNFGGFFVGQGVIVSNVSRDHDVFVTNMLQEKSIEFGLQNGQTRALSELERVFNISEETISTDINRFFDSWQELSANPSGLVERDIVIQRGELLSEKFHNTINDLNKIKDNINDSLISKIDGVNSQIKEVAELNQRIFTIEIQGQSANSARDRRDVLVKQLSSSLGVQSYPDSKGMLAVQLPGGLPLVQGNMAMTIEGQQNGTDLDLVLHTGGVTRPIGLNNLGGEFEGLVNIRDQFIPSIKDDLDRLAYEITEAVNTTHAAGAGLDSVLGVTFFQALIPCHHHLLLIHGLMLLEIYLLLSAIPPMLLLRQLLLHLQQLHQAITVMLFSCQTLVKTILSMASITLALITERLPQLLAWKAIKTN